MKFMDQEGGLKQSKENMRIPLGDPSLVQKGGSLHVRYESVRQVVKIIVENVGRSRVLSVVMNGILRINFLE